MWLLPFRKIRISDLFCGFKKNYIYMDLSILHVEVCVFMPCRQTYLTGSPQRENIVGCGTHSGDAFVAKIQPGRERQEHVMKEILHWKRRKFRKNYKQRIYSIDSCVQANRLVTPLLQTQIPDESLAHYTYVLNRRLLGCCKGSVGLHKRFSSVEMTPPISCLRVQLCLLLIRQSAGKQRAL